MTTEWTIDFWRFSIPESPAGPLLVGSYDPLLVLVSIAIACLAGVTALLLVDRMVASRQPEVRWWWHCTGALVMGLGIWTMHFTGMLAFSLPLDMSYDLLWTLASVIPAILGSGAALYFLAGTDLGGGKLQVGAVLLALAIATMHYTGMEAMRLNGVLHYDLLYFVLSLVIAHILAVTALYIRFEVHDFLVLSDQGLTVIAGTVIGMAVAGMHYTAMGAARFFASPESIAGGMTFSQTALALTIAGATGVILFLSGLATWVDRQKHIHRTLERLASTDSLTGLSNRAQLAKQLDRALIHAQRHTSRVSVLFLDLDDFKTINDSLGHAAGDLVLTEVAKRLTDSLRGDDIVARFGGDEFVIVGLDLVTPDDAAFMAERLLEVLRTPVEVNKWKMHHDASIGISVFPDDGETAEELIQQADSAMYRAKQAHLGYCFFNRAMTDQALERVRLGNDMRDGLKQGQFYFCYQPWVDLLSGEWLGLEALARWTHPLHGQVPPARFIPVAERSGLILQLGEWTLWRACRQAREWLDEGYDFGRIAVNIAAPQVTRSDLPQMVQRILQETGLPGSRLQLEITESSFMTQNPNIIEQLHAMRELGLTLAVDDFGIGYSSLSYLKNLPVDKLKIDRSFVQGIPDDDKDCAIVRTVIELGASLGFTVVAEGIETETQRRTLLDLGCGKGQGFLFALPVAGDAVKPPVLTTLREPSDKS